MTYKTLLCVIPIGILWAAPASSATFEVDTSADVVANDGVLSLREAIEQANAIPGKDFIVMADSLEEGIVLAGDPLVISDDVDIDGTYSRPPVLGKGGDKQFVFTGPIEVNGNNESNVFIIDPGLSSVELRDMIVISGGTSGAGGGIFIRQNSIVLLNDIVVAECHADLDGGGIYSFRSSLTLRDCRIRDNTVGSTAKSPSAATGETSPLESGSLAKGDILSSALSGGGIFCESSELSIIDSDIERNRAEGNGGGVYCDALSPLAITRGTIANNSAGDSGGGIATEGALDLIDCHIDGNQCERGGSGGGIIAGKGNVSLSNTEIKNNISDFGGGLFCFSNTLVSASHCLISGNTSFCYGGGIQLSVVPLALNNTTITGNTSKFLGGGLICEGDSRVEGSNITISDNVAEGGGGAYFSAPTVFRGARIIIAGNRAMNSSGGLHLSGETILSEVTISDNTAEGTSGGFSNYGSAIIRNATIEGNTSGGDAGGIANAGSLILERVSVSRNTAGENGGGIHNFGDIDIRESLLYSNHAASNGAAISSTTGEATMLNSTLSANRTETGNGGAIYADGNSTFDLIHTTIADNHASFGGGVYVSDSVVSIGNSILAGNAAGNLGPDLYGEITSLDFNLIQDPSFGSLSGPVGSTIVGVDPLLGPLTDNGGPTMTHNPQVGSPAIDSGNNNLTIANGLIRDQREFTRVADIRSIANVGGGVDIGAVEAIAVEIRDKATLEDRGNMSFSVTLSHSPPVGENVTVRVHTASVPNGASENVDYVPILDKTLIFESLGPILQETSVAILDDDTAEPNESFRVILTEAGGATVFDSSATGTIIDDIQPWPGDTVHPPTNVRASGGGEGTIRVVWDRNLEISLLGYNLYRSTSPAFEQEIQLNLDGLILDPEFIDGTDISLPDGSNWYYQVEAVGENEGLVFSDRSETALGTVGGVELYLPRVRAATDVVVRYPISLLNAQGILEEGFRLSIEYPEHIEDLGFQRTALTAGFTSLVGSDNSDDRIFTITSSSEEFHSSTPLNGQGALVYLTFVIPPENQDEIAGTTVGYFRIDPDSGAEFMTSVETIHPFIGGPGLLELRNNYTLGDVTGDGMVMNDDFIRSASLALGLPPTDEEFLASDLNADAVIDILDMSLLMNLLSGAQPKGDWMETDSKGLGSESWRLTLEDQTVSIEETEASLPVILKRPDSTLPGPSIASMIIRYPSDELLLQGLEMPEGPEYADMTLFYDQRDYSRSFKKGRVKMIMVREGNRELVSPMATMLFNREQGSTGPIVNFLDMFPGKLAREKDGFPGEDIGWVEPVEFGSGILGFGAGYPNSLLRLIELFPTEPRGTREIPFLRYAGEDWYE